MGMEGVASTHINHHRRREGAENESVTRLVRWWV